MTNAVYSWACYNHAISGTPWGFDWNSYDGTTTVGKAFTQWLHQTMDNSSSGEQPAFQWIEEDCEGFACGRACNYDQYSYPMWWTWRTIWEGLMGEETVMKTGMQRTKSALASYLPQGASSSWQVVPAE